MELSNTQNVASTKQFDSTEIKELTEIRSAYEQLTVSLGQLSLQRRELEKSEKKLEEKLVALEVQEKAFLDKIVNNYGEGTFDMGTGVFTPKVK